MGHRPGALNLQKKAGEAQRSVVDRFNSELYNVLMSNATPVTYQRSQIEQAIASVEGLNSADGTIPAALRSNIKRLLDIDRKPRAKKLTSRPERLAFYDEDEAAGQKTEGPGKGAEIAYRPYHAFALLIGTRLIGSGMPQSRIVVLLRELRDELERKFEDLAATPITDFPDDRPSNNQKKRSPATPEERADLARNGYLIFEPENMTFLVARAGPSAEAIQVPGQDRRDFVTGNVCDFEALKDRLRFFSHEGQGVTVIELTNAIHKLMTRLPLTQIRKRGRS